MKPVNSNPPFVQPWLQVQGLDSFKQSDKAKAIYTDDTKNPVLGTGTYEVDARPSQSDTVEFKNQHDIFAKVNAGKNDTVKLDGDGWQKVDDPNSPITSETKDGHAVYINKKNNSAVTVNGGAKVELGGDAQKPNNAQKPLDAPAPLKFASHILPALQLIFPMLGMSRPQSS